MPKTPDKRDDIQFTIKVPTRVGTFMEAYRVRKKLPSITDVFRDMLGGLESNFGLPPFLSERLAQEMEERDMTIMEYAQDLLGRHAVQLLQEDAARSPDKKGGRKA